MGGSSTELLLLLGFLAGAVVFTLEPARAFGAGVVAEEPL